MGFTETGPIERGAPPASSAMHKLVWMNASSLGNTQAFSIPSARSSVITVVEYVSAWRLVTVSVPITAHTRMPGVSFAVGRRSTIAIVPAHPTMNGAQKRKIGRRSWAGSASAIAMSGTKSATPMCKGNTNHEA